MHARLGFDLDRIRFVRRLDEPLRADEQTSRSCASGTSRWPSVDEMMFLPVSVVWWAVPVMGRGANGELFEGGARPLLSPVPGEAEVSEGESKGWGTSERVWQSDHSLAMGPRPIPAPTAPGYNCPRRFQIKPQLLRPAAMSV